MDRRGVADFSGARCAGNSGWALWLVPPLPGPAAADEVPGREGSRLHRGRRRMRDRAIDGRRGCRDHHRRWRRCGRGPAERQRDRAQPLARRAVRQEQRPRQAARPWRQAGAEQQKNGVRPKGR